MSSEQQTLGGTLPPKSHLQSNPIRRAHARDSSSLPADPEKREWYCADCGARITCSPEVEQRERGELYAGEHREYGHRPGCQHKLPRDGGGR